MSNAKGGFEQATPRLDASVIQRLGEKFWCADLDQPVATG
jgi:hypothetical protein